MTFARKNARILHKIVRKIFSRILGGHVPPCPRLLRLWLAPNPSRLTLVEWRTLGMVIWWTLEMSDPNLYVSVYVLMCCQLTGLITSWSV